MVASCSSAACTGSFPGLDFEALDAFEFGGVASDQGGSQVPCLRGDEEIQRADGCAFALEVGADLSVVAGIFKAKIDHSEQIEEGIEGGSFVGSAGFLDARPKFRCDETGDRRVLASWKSIEGGLTAQNLDAGARVEHVERAHEEGYLLPFQDGPFVFLGPGRRIGKVGGFRFVFGKVTRHVPDGAEVRQRVRGRPEDDGIIPLFDQNFSALEAKCLWQADGLAAAVLEDLRGVHSYRVYLFGEISSGEKWVRFFWGESLGE